MKQAKNERKERGAKGFAGLFFKGMAMGAADVVPGVSGGTIALLVGVYQELVDAIKNAGSKAILKIFKRGGLAEYWRMINGNFLLFLVGGIGTSIVLLSKLIVHLIATYPVLVWSFFFGLILASIWFVSSEIKQWSWKTVLCLIAGGLAGYFISTAPQGSLPNSSLYLFLSGAIAICAMILPGISGSFILLLLGKYTLVMTAVHEFNFAILIPFGLGAIVGLLSFSHLLSWLLKRFYALTLAVLTGFMAGAIVRVWPWQIPASETNPVERFVTPMQFAAEGDDTQLLPSLGFILLGIGVVVLLELLTRHSERVKGK